jgi:hypothetical protein
MCQYTTQGYFHPLWLIYNFFSRSQGSSLGYFFVFHEFFLGSDAFSNMGDFNSSSSNNDEEMF